MVNKMNIYNFVNKIQQMINYSLFGKTTSCINNKEVSLDEAIFMIALGVTWFVIAFWWLAPIQFLLTKLKIRDIMFFDII